MKRSEALRSLPAGMIWKDRYAALDMAENAGVTWEPEEEMLAERLGMLGGVMGAAAENRQWLREATEVEKAIAVNFYNRRKGIEKVIFDLKDALLHRLDLSNATVTFTDTHIRSWVALLGGEH